MMAFIIGVLFGGVLSIIYVLFPPRSIAKAFEILKYMYTTKRIKKKYKRFNNI